MLRGTALYDFQPDDFSTGQISVKANARLQILSTDDANWWYVRPLDEAIPFDGYVPASYVCTELEPSDPWAVETAAAAAAAQEQLAAEDGEQSKLPFGGRRRGGTFPQHTLHLAAEISAGTHPEPEPEPEPEGGTEPQQTHVARDRDPAEEQAAQERVAEESGKRLREAAIRGDTEAMELLLRPEQHAQKLTKASKTLLTQLREVRICVCARVCLLRRSCSFADAAKHL